MEEEHVIATLSNTAQIGKPPSFLSSSFYCYPNSSRTHGNVQDKCQIILAKGGKNRISNSKSKWLLLLANVHFKIFTTFFLCFSFLQLSAGLLNFPFATCIAFCRCSIVPVLPFNLFSLIHLNFYELLPNLQSHETSLQCAMACPTYSKV